MVESFLAPLEKSNLDKDNYSIKKSESMILSAFRLPEEINYSGLNILYDIRKSEHQIDEKDISLWAEF